MMYLFRNSHHRKASNQNSFQFKTTLQYHRTMVEKIFDNITQNRVKILYNVKIICCIFATQKGNILIKPIEVTCNLLLNYTFNPTNGKP